MMKRIAALMLLVYGGALWAAPVTYKWRDDKGVWNVSNLPPAKSCQSDDCIRIRAGLGLQGADVAPADATGSADPEAMMLQNAADRERYQTALEDWYLKAHADVRERIKRHGGPQQGDSWLYAPSAIQCKYGGVMLPALKYLKERQGIEPPSGVAAKILNQIDPFWDRKVCAG